MCKVNGCTHTGRTKLGFCNAHYSRFKKTGSVGRKTIRQWGDGYLASGYVRFRKKFVHVAIAEKILGRELKYPIVVHHANENRLDNSNANLVVCPDRKYHKLLHARMKALSECGNPNLRKCFICGVWDDPENLVRYCHRPCWAKYQRDWKVNKEIKKE
jgi:hypothetical protein